MIRPPSFLLGAVLLAGCDDGGADRAAPSGGKQAADLPPLVRVEPVAVRSVQQKIETTSYLQAEHAVVVFSRVTGRVLEVPVDEGQMVTKGDVLARLDDREMRAALRQIEVQIAEKKVRHELAKLEHEASQHRENQARVDEQRLKGDLERLEKLDPDLVSEKQLDDARFAVFQAEDSYKVGQFQTRKAKLDVETALQAIEQLEARETEIRVQLAEHEIRAPITGVVSRRMIKGGEAIAVTTELFEVVDTAHLVSYLDRPQRELALVEKAKTVVFTTDAYPGREFTANIDLISPVVDRATGSFQLRMRVLQTDTALLRPGLFIRAKILTEENREAIMVPKTAVLAEGEESVLFYVRDPLDGRGKARRLKLETGIEDDESVECRNRGAGGLQPGDLVIVGGQQDLDDQQEVEISKG